MSDELDEVLGTLESYWTALLRRRWWLLGSVILAWAAAWGISWILPRAYQSEAVIAVERQDVFDPSGAPTGRSSLQSVYRVLSKQALSPARLQAIVDRHHLYAEAQPLAAFRAPADPVERMRRDIEIQLVPAPGGSNEFKAVRMRYAAPSPELAQDVARDLIAPFFERDPQALSQSSEDPSTALASQVEEARHEMDEMEARVAEFKSTHSAGLPGQAAPNTRRAVPKHSPEYDRQLAAMLREYDNAKAIYASILQEQMESESSPGAQVPQDAGPFRITETPNLPNTPVVPDRFKFSAIGSACGAFLGLGLIVIVELADVRIRNEQELKDLPVHFLISIPPLRTAEENRKQTVWRWLDACGVTLTLGLIAAGNYLAFFRG